LTTVPALIDKVVDIVDIVGVVVHHGALLSIQGLFWLAFVVMV